MEVAGVVVNDGIGGSHKMIISFIYMSGDEGRIEERIYTRVVNGIMCPGPNGGSYRCRIGRLIIMGSAAKSRWQICCVLLLARYRR